MEFSFKMGKPKYSFSHLFIGGRFMTTKQSLFVDEYLADLNATQAAIRAGYSTRHASEIGHQLLKKNGVSDAVARALAERSRRTGITQDRILKELARIAFCNPIDVIDPTTLGVRADAKVDDLAAVAYIKSRQKFYGEHGRYVEQEVRFFDKLKALDMLSRHLGLYKNDAGLDTQIYGCIVLPAVLDNFQPPAE